MKPLRIFLVSLFFAVSASVIPYTVSADIATGLVGHWALDEGSGTTAGDSAGGNTGALVNGPAWVAGEVGSGAVDLSGANYVQIDDNDALTPASAITVSAWVKFGSADTSSGAGIVTKMRALSGFSGWALYRGADEKYSFQIRDQASPVSTAPQIATSDSAYADTNWHHVAGVYDGASVKIYVDGSSADSTPPSTTILLSNTTNDVCLGTAGAYGDICGTASTYVSGTLDDIRIYSRALSPSDISELYALGSQSQGSGGGTPPPSPVSGVCGSTQNSCTSGTLSDTADSGTEYLWQCLGSNGGSTASCSLPIPQNQGDTTPPAISSVATASVTSSSATISWTTDEISDTQIEYGLTTGYGSMTALSSSFVSSHAQTISSLSANTLYHYRVRSKDASGNQAVSGDYTFTTSAAAPPPPQSNTPAPPPVSWTPPIGIPAPSFGITETHFMYQLGSGQTCSTHPQKCYDFGSGLEPYRDAGAGPYTHYVDNTVVGATDSNNPYGTPAKPRVTIPQNLPAGSVVEMRGGPYTYGNYNGNSMVAMSGTGSASRPIFIRGYSENNKTVILGRRAWVRGHYIIIENLYFNANQAADGAITIRPWPNAPADPAGFIHHISVRHNEAGNITKGPGSGSIMSGSGLATSEIEDVVFYNNHIHGDDVDVYDPPAGPDNMEKDTVGVFPGRYTNRVWVVDNHIHHMGGDSVGTGHAVGYTARNYYIGRNLMHDNGEEGVDLKEVENFVVSQNTIYDMYGQSAGSSGGGIVVHYGPTDSPRNTWIIFNEVYDTYIGIQIGGDVTDPVYVIGNVLHDLTHPSSTGVGLQSWGSDDIYAIGNVIYNVDNGVNITGGSSRLVFSNNIVSKILNPNGYHMQLTDSGYRNAAEMADNIFYQPNGTVRKNWSGATPACTGCLENVDPLFINPDGNNFGLQSGSPAIDAGSSDPIYDQFQSFYGVNIKRDFNGSSRPQGSGWDIGAFEYASGGSSPSTYTLTVSRTGAGSGTVTGTGISCGSDCSESGLFSGTSITLTASAGTGSTFSGWSGGGCSGTGTCTVTVSSNTSVSASFSASAAPSDTTDPSISIASPSPGATISGTVTLNASASDNVGVVGVQWKLDGSDLGSELTTAPYSGSWNTVGVSNGSHTLAAVARDAAGNTRTSSSVTVVVSNASVSAPAASGGSSSGGGGGGSSSTVSAPPTGTFTPTVPQRPAVLGYVSPSSCSPTATSTYLFARNLSLGSSHPDVKALQETLNLSGYAVSASGPGSKGEETSYFGPATMRAVQKLQGAYKITPTGTVGSITRLVLSTLPYRSSSSCATSAPTATPSSSYTFTLPLDLGSTGPEVTALQTLLSSMPSVYPEGLVTGYFGSLTQKAVGRFQELHGLARPGDPAYGYVGPGTRARLNSAK